MRDRLAGQSGGFQSYKERAGMSEAPAAAISCEFRTGDETPDILRLDLDDSVTGENSSMSRKLRTAFFCRETVSTRAPRGRHPPDVHPPEVFRRI